MNNIPCLILSCILAYLLGSLSGGIITSKFANGPDLHTVGSKSTGATNVQRTMGWKYGINSETGKNACYLVYVYLPNGVQLTWHCNEYAIYECYPPIDAEWDGQVCMTMEKLLTYISNRFFDTKMAA